MRNYYYVNFACKFIILLTNKYNYLFCGILKCLSQRFIRPMHLYANDCLVSLSYNSSLENILPNMVWRKTKENV